MCKEKIAISISKEVLEKLKDRQVVGQSMSALIEEMVTTNPAFNIQQTDLKKAILGVKQAYTTLVNAYKNNATPQDEE